MNHLPKAREREWQLLVLSFILCLLVPCSTHAQSGRLFTADAELSSSMVNQIYQDRKGFIWIATYNGLDRYDGNVFQSFHRAQRPGSLLSSHVNCILEDRNGRFLVGTDKGLQFYDEARGEFRDIRFIRGENPYETGCHVLSMVQRQNGEVWISTSGHGTFRLEPGAMDAEGISLFEGDGFVDHMVEAADGTIWLAVTNYGIYRWKDGIFQRYLAERAADLGTCRLAFDRNGHLFAGALQGGLFVFNEQKDAFEQIGTSTPPPFTHINIVPAV